MTVVTVVITVDTVSSERRLTVFVLGLLRQNLEVEQPCFYPGQHEGDDGQQVPKGPLGQQLHTYTYTGIPLVLSTSSE